MTLYSDEELKAQSIALLRYKEEVNVAYNKYVATVAMITNKSEKYVEDKIVEYSELTIEVIK